MLKFDLGGVERATLKNETWGDSLGGKSVRRFGLSRSCPWNVGTWPTVSTPKTTLIEHSTEV